MSIKGVWKKFLDYMRLDFDEDEEFDDDFDKNQEFSDNFGKESKKSYCVIDFTNMITLPDGGFILKVVNLDTRDIVGIAVISKNKTPSLVSTATDENLIDDENKRQLEDFLQKLCDALKA